MPGNENGIPPETRGGPKRLLPVTAFAHEIDHHAGTFGGGDG
jgi:hypothetical protein